MNAALCLCVLLAAPPAGPAKELPQTNKVRYRGYTAAQWGPELLDADGRTAERAAVALQAIGPEGLRYFLEGLRGDSPGTRHVCVIYLPFTEAKKYERAFRPALEGVLGHADPAARRRAALLLRFCKFKKSLPALRKAHAAERDADAKVDIGRYIELLERGE